MTFSAIFKHVVEFHMDHIEPVPLTNKKPEVRVAYINSVAFIL